MSEGQNLWAKRARRNIQRRFHESKAGRLELVQRLNEELQRTWTTCRANACCKAGTG